MLLGPNLFPTKVSLPGAPDAYVKVAVNGRRTAGRGGDHRLRRGLRHAQPQTSTRGVTDR